MTIVEKSFSLITMLPDKVLRWIGGHPETYGQEIGQQWTEAAKGQVKEDSKEMPGALGQVQKQAMSQAAKAAKASQGGGSADFE